MSDTLDKIVADKRRHVAGRKSQRSLSVESRTLARAADPPRGFAKALEGHHRRRPLRPDRRDQEGLAQQGPDPRRTSIRRRSPEPTSAAARPASRS